MNQVIRYKQYYLLSNRFVIISTIFLLCILNFQAVVNSGILFSGGGDFNTTQKYALLLNNYISVASFYGLLLSAYLGSSVIGPDIETGNIYIILTSYPYKTKYFLGTYISVLLYMALIQLLLLLDLVILFLVYDVSFLGSDIAFCFAKIFLNSVVVLSITGYASIYMKGHNAAFIGMLGYAFFSVYTFNQVPFINTRFIFNVVQYKNYLCNLFPITHVLAPSYTDPEVIRAYGIQTLIPDTGIYQCVYIFFVVLLSCYSFKHKEI